MAVPIFCAHPCAHLLVAPAGRRAVQDKEAYDPVLDGQIICRCPSEGSWSPKSIYRRSRRGRGEYLSAFSAFSAVNLTVSMLKSYATQFDIFKRKADDGG